MPHLGQMRQTVNETRRSIASKDLKSASLLDMSRNIFVSTLGSNPTDVANSVNGVMVARLHWARRFQVIVQLGRLDGVRNNGGSSNLPWLTKWVCKPCRIASLSRYVI